MAQAQASPARLYLAYHPPYTSESQTMTTTTSTSASLLDCPLEIRILIYAHYFSDGPAHTLFGRHGSFESKQSLLRTNKRIRAEALPIFRQHHVFLVGNQFPLNLHITNSTHHLAGKAITRIEVVIRLVVARQFPQIIQHFLDHCPQLRFLKFRWSLPTRGTATRSQISPGSAGSRLLRQLCLRLVRLEIVLFHLEGHDFREVQGFAPGAYWTLEWEGRPPHWSSSRTGICSLWSLECARLVAEVTDQSGDALT